MATPAPPAVLLEFLDGWTHLTTKDVSLEKVFKPNQEDTEGLEVLRSLESLRRAAVFEEGLDSAHLERMFNYVRELEAIVSKLEPDGTPTGLVTQWTSPMAGKPSYYHRLQGLACEMGMATYMYGHALRAAAIQMVAQGGVSASATGSPETAAAAAAEATTLLRRAAGVFQWLQDKGLPRIAHKLPTERPAEAIMSMSKVHNQMCLAEAQMVAAARAEQRGVGPVLASALHAAAWELWETAARTLKTHTGDYVSLSDHLRRYLASSATICRARALRALAIDLRVNKEQAGQAEAACQLAAQLFAAAHAACDTNASWRHQAHLESAVLEEVRLKCQKDREHVYYQQVAKTPPDLPPGKVLVAAIPFQLTAPAPEAPPPGSAAEAVAGGSASAESGPQSPTAGAPPVQRAPSALAAHLDHSLSLREK